MTLGGTRLSHEPERARTLRRAWPLLLRPHRALLGIALAMSLLAAGLQMVLPVLVGMATNAVADGDRHRLALAAGWAGAGTLATLVAGLVAQRLLARAGEAFLATVRLTAVERMLARPLAFFDRHPTGELVARATTDVVALSSFVRDWLPTLVNAALLLVVTLTVLFVSAWQLALLTLLYLPGLVVVAIRFRRVAGPAHARFAHARARTAVVAQETLAARPWLQGIGASRAREDQAAAADLLMLEATAGALRADNRTSALQLLQQVTLALVLLCGGLMVDADMVTVGTVVTFVLALRQLYQPLDTLGVAYGAIEGARAELARIVEVVEAPALPDPLPGDGSASRHPGGLAIELDSVSYSYGDERWAVTDVGLRVEAGEHVAVCGTTGSGKSTIAKLFAGLYEPATGTVRIGDRLAADWHPDALRRAVVLMPQDVHLVAGTVADNLRLVPGAHSDADLLAAVERAGLSSWLASLPAGLATAVGDKGANLSAGERQLVAIARVGLADPAVLILDEATADVDPTTERLLNEALERSARGRTTVVVAHRPATAERADRQILVEGGRIIPSTRAPGA